MKRLYEKRNGKLVRVHEYRELDALSEGWHLVHVKRGSKSIHFNSIKPAKPELVAAIMEYQDLFLQILSESGNCRPGKIPTTPKEREAWSYLQKKWGSCMAHYPSLAEIVEKALAEFAREVEMRKVRDATDMD